MHDKPAQTLITNSIKHEYSFKVLYVNFPSNVKSKKLISLDENTHLSKLHDMYLPFNGKAESPEKVNKDDSGIPNS